MILLGLFTRYLIILKDLEDFISTNMAYIIKFQLLLLPSPFSDSNKIFLFSPIALAWHCITILSFFWENRLTHQDDILQLTYILLISKMITYLVTRPRRINSYYHSSKDIRNIFGFTEIFNMNMLVFFWISTIGIFDPFLAKAS